MSMVTPPPERATSQKCAAWGPLCFSDCLIRVGRPSAPSSSSAFSRTYLGAKHSSSAYISLTCARAHAAIMRSASARFRHRGFSMTTCLPAAAASSATWQCRARSEERRVGKECRSRLWPYFSSRRRHTRSLRDWSSDVCSSDLFQPHILGRETQLLGVHQLDLRAGARRDHAIRLGEIQAQGLLHDYVLAGGSRVQRHLAMQGEIGRASCRERV